MEKDRNSNRNHQSETASEKENNLRRDNPFKNKDQEPVKQDLPGEQAAAEQQRKETLTERD
jgi:hypothetical protein